MSNSRGKSLFFGIKIAKGENILSYLNLWHLF